MRIKFLVGVAGLRYAYAPGEVADIPRRDAERWIEAGVAEPVGEAPPAKKQSREKRSRKRSK